MDENMKRSQDHQSPPHRSGKPPETAQNHQPPPPQKCPRCDSSNTKFCYYNNYSLSQPRYFCKGCRRYWTHGGTLRNVPVGGSCRKSKRPKISTASSSTSEIARTTQALPAPTHPQNFAGMDPGQGSRPSIIGNNSFYTCGTLLSSLAALQTLPAGINQPPSASLNPAVASVGGGRFGANMGLLQGMCLSSSRPQPPQQLQTNNGFLPSQQFVNRGAANSAAYTGFWSGGSGFNAGEGGDQVGFSFNSNQWSSDINHQGFNP